MTSLHQERLKGLLGVIVKRHMRHGEPSHPVGQFIAEEAGRIRADDGSSGFVSNDDVDRQLVDRLYRRFLLPRHSTVECVAHNSLALDEISS